jgi:hypothetical protein
MGTMEIDFDLKKHFDEAVERIEAQEIDQALTPELRDSAITQPRASLYARVQEALRNFRVDLIPAALADYKNALRERMQFERTHGALKQPPMPDDEVRRVAATGYFRRNLINGFEVKAIAAGLEPGETIDINAGALRAIKTDRREIARGSDFFDRLRPSGYSKEFWLRQCTPAPRLAEAEDMAKRETEIAQRPFSSTSGPNAGESTVIQR